MTLIGMTEAGKRAGMTRPGIRRALQAAGIELVEIHPKAYAVEEKDLAAFIAVRGENPGPGRPRGARNKTQRDGTEEAGDPG